MKQSLLQGTLKRFRRTPWRFQQTFQTPLKDLQPFVGAIFSSLEAVTGACLTIDQVVFEPKNLIDLLARHSLPPLYEHELSITADDKPEAEELLKAVLSDWVDFIFIPAPKPFVIYADHDEYITFYANSKSNLNRVVKSLTSADFNSVPDYERRL